MLGKEKCKALKEIRRKIAEENDIEYAVSECSHKGDCKGTCPKCEAELRYLEKELEKRQSLGRKVAVAGVSVGMAAAITGCAPASVAEFMVSPVNFFLGEAGYGTGAVKPDFGQLAGDAAIVEEIDGDMGYDPDFEEEIDGDIAYEPDSETPDSVCPDNDCEEDEIEGGEAFY